MKPEMKRHKRKVPVRKFRKVTGEWVKSSVEWLVDMQCGCCYFKVWEDDDGREYDVCIGWLEGCDPDDPDVIHGEGDPDWGVSWKIAFQDPDNAMQCDFGVDWNMPYDPDTGEVYDTCNRIYSGMKTKKEWNQLASWMNKEAVGAVRFDQEMRGKSDDN